jgi:hypothetical protein
MKKIDNILFEELNRIKALLNEQSVKSDRLGTTGQFQSFVPQTPKFKGKLVPSLSQNEQYRSKFLKDPCELSGVDAFYRQKMVDVPGYYSDFKLGECSAVEYFGGQETALNTMNINRNIYQDEQGYFFKVNTEGSTKETQFDVSIYLPQDEFFKQLQGKAKSFITFSTCPAACKYKQGQQLNDDEQSSRYVLLYQLADPSKATETSIATPQGIQTFGLETIDRGWQFSTVNVLESGYYSVSNPEQMATSEIKEYTSTDYGENQARSEFDIWYDGTAGTIAQIGIAVLLSYVTAGAAAPYLAAIESQGARIFANLALQTTVELTVAIPEAVYLYGRGMNSNAAFVIMLSLIPVVQAKVFKGEFADPAAFGYVHELTRRYGTGQFKTPADLKRYVNSLGKTEKASLEKLLKGTQDALIANGGKMAQEEVAAVMGLVLKNSDTGINKIGFSLGRVGYEQIIAQYVPTATQNLIKNATSLFGTLGSTLLIHPITAYLIKDADWVKNPQKIDIAQKTLEKIFNSQKDKNKEKVQKEVKGLQTKIEKAAYNQNKSEVIQPIYDLIFYIDDLLKIAENKIVLGQSLEVLKTQYKSVIIGQLLSEIARAIYEEMKASQGASSPTANYLDQNGLPVSTKPWFEIQIETCKSEELYKMKQLNFTNIDNPSDIEIKRACSFRDFIRSTYPSMANLKHCGFYEEGEQVPPPKWFYIKDCEFKKIWNGVETKTNKRYCELWLESLINKKKQKV